MSEPFTPGLGAVFSGDIAVPDHDREIRFYSRVLCTGATPLWREPDLMNNLGVPIIGVGARSDATAGLPLQWMPHIQVGDVGASVQSAAARGGAVLMHDQDEQGTSRWAVLRDPNGAAFGVVPVVPAEAVAGVNAPGPDGEYPAMGRIQWLDLTVPDAPSTRDFYRQVVGWTVQDVQMSDQGESYADYIMLGEQANPVAGVCHARGTNADLPPAWLLYLPVNDIAESLRRVAEEGGRVVKAKSGKDGTCAYAVIQDPVGAYLGLVPG